MLRIGGHRGPRRAASGGPGGRGSEKNQIEIELACRRRANLMSRSYFLALLLLAFLACTKAPPQSAAGRQAVDAELAEQLSRAVGDIAAGQARLDYISAFAQVSVVRGKQRRSFDAVLQAAPPGRLS